MVEHKKTVRRKTTAADAIHCRGVGPRTYGTSLRLSCDGNNYLVSICFSHSASTECKDILEVVFSCADQIEGFYCRGRVTVADEERGLMPLLIR